MITLSHRKRHQTSQQFQKLTQFIILKTQGHHYEATRSYQKRLPRGIDVCINSKNVLSFRVRFRKKGYPDQIKTFPDE